jgi:hypothetical protein
MKNRLNLLAAGVLAISLPLLSSCAGLGLMLGDSINIDISGLEGRNPLAESSRYPDYGTPTLMTVAEAPPAEMDDRTVYIHNLLGTVDPDTSYQIFMNSTGRYMLWVDELGGGTDHLTLAIALHETSHYLTKKLYGPLEGYPRVSYFYLGEIYPTNLKLLTAHYQIVSRTLPAELRRDSFFSLYIAGMSDYPGATFMALLDELTAYSNEAGFDLAWQRYNDQINAGTDVVITHNWGIRGMGIFMLYLQSYIKSARLYYPDTYRMIETDDLTLAYIQALWSGAEEQLIDASEIVSRLGVRGAPLMAYDHLRYAYSAEFLTELDALGIRHMSMDELRQFFPYL